MKTPKKMRSFRFTEEELSLLKEVREKLFSTEPPEYTPGGKIKNISQAKTIVLCLRRENNATRHQGKKRRHN